MEASTWLVETPYLAVADNDGNFTISDVPPGEYTIKVWNKNQRLKPDRDPITVVVPEEGDVTIEITLKR